jgi:hypothetical protein
MELQKDFVGYDVYGNIKNRYIDYQSSMEIISFVTDLVIS